MLLVIRIVSKGADLVAPEDPLVQHLVASVVARAQVGLHWVILRLEVQAASVARPALLALLVNRRTP